MRLFNFIAWTGIAIAVALVAQPAKAEAVVQKVCHDDAKGKPVCKTIKTHKKVEGTPVPERAPTIAKKKK